LAIFHFFMNLISHVYKVKAPCWIFDWPFYRNGRKLASGQLLFCTLPLVVVCVDTSSRSCVQLKQQYTKDWVWWSYIGSVYAKNGSYRTFPTPVSSIYQLAWTARTFSSWNKLYVCAGSKKQPHLGSCAFTVHQCRAASKIQFVSITGLLVYDYGMHFVPCK